MFSFTRRCVDMECMQYQCRCVEKTTEQQGLGATHLDDCLSVVSVRYFSMSYWPGLTFISWKWCQKFPIIRNFILSKDSAINFA